MKSKVLRLNENEINMVLDGLAEKYRYYSNMLNDAQNKKDNKKDEYSEKEYYTLCDLCEIYKIKKDNYKDLWTKLKGE